jgi:hypothetical protein
VRAVDPGWKNRALVRPIAKRAGVLALIGGFAVLGLIVLNAAAAAGAERVPGPVPAGSFVVSTVDGRLLVLDGAGSLVRGVPGTIGSSGAQGGVALAPDRLHAFVAISLGSPKPWRLNEIDLVTGSRRKLANAVSPAVSPDGTRLAFLAVASDPNDDTFRVTALVIRNLHSGRNRSIPFQPPRPLGTPPELVINWSPDGKRIALFDGTQIRLATVATARTVGSQPPAPGTAPTSPQRTGSLSPAFLDDRTLVVLDGCCIGPQRLVAIDLASGSRRPFAALRAPTVNLTRIRPGVLLAVTAEHRLLVVTRANTHQIAGNISSASAGR